METFLIILGAVVVVLALLAEDFIMPWVQSFDPKEEDEEDKDDEDGFHFEL